MSLPRRGSRIIHVDGVRYRWVVTGHREPSCGIAVEDADAPSGLLLADADENAVIVPAVVAAVIRRARHAGWDPHATRPPYRLASSSGGAPLRGPGGRAAGRVVEARGAPGARIKQQPP